MNWLLKFLVGCPHRRLSTLVFARGARVNGRWFSYAKRGQAPDYRLCVGCGAEVDCWVYARLPAARQTNPPKKVEPAFLPALLRRLKSLRHQRGRRPGKASRESSAAATRAPAPSPLSWPERMAR